MPLQHAPIYTAPQRTNLSSELGRALGTGLGQGLQSLAQQQLENLSRRRMSSSLQNIGIHPKLASLLPLLPPEIQKAAFQNLPEMIGFQPGIIDQQAMQPQGAQQGMAPESEGASPEQIQNAVNKTFSSLFTPPQEKRAREELEIKKSKAAAETERDIESKKRHVEKLAQPLFREIREHSANANNVYHLATDIKKALEDIKPTDIGYGGLLTPKFLRSDTGQYSESKLSQLVLAQAQLGKGVPSRMRLTLEQAAKPQVWQRRKTLNNLLNDILNNKELLRNRYKGKALESLQNEWGENIPRNFESIINKQSESLLKMKKSSEEGLPDVAMYKEGTKLRKGDRVIQKVNGKWVDVDQEGQNQGLE